MKKDGAMIVLALLIAVAFAFALYSTFKPNPCETIACFQDHMALCTRASFINEEPEASWSYNVKRRVADGCEIEVKLLQAKEGELNLRDFKGHAMTCTYPRGMVAYPDKDMSRCHGRLKEDMQGIVIEKLHRYLVNNLLDVKQALGNITLSQ